MVEDKWPRPPKALNELHALDERWGKVLNWIEQEVSDAYVYRSQAFGQAQFIADLKKRAKVHVKICENHEARLNELEWVEEQFKQAYDACNKKLDHNALIDYSVKILPRVREESSKERKCRQQMQMARASEKSEKFRSREEKKEERLKAKMKELAIAKEKGVGEEK